MGTFGKKVIFPLEKLKNLTNTYKTTNWDFW